MGHLIGLTETRIEDQADIAALDRAVAVLERRYHPGLKRVPERVRMAILVMKVESQGIRGENHCV